MSFWSFFKRRPAPATDARAPGADSDVDAGVAGADADAHAPDSAPAPRHVEAAPPVRPAQPAPPSPTRDAPPDVERLLLLGQLGGPSEDDAARTLQRLRSSPWEARAVEAILARARVAPIGDRLAVTAASTLIDRGESARALPLLARAASSPALLLAADLVADAGDVPRAIALVERVLLRDLDYPGARERHRRWRALLGFEPIAKAADDGATRVVPREADAPFLLVREVARGGAGAVYEAEDRELRRRVAVKVYHHPDRDGPQLRHEARVAASLHGTGIIRVLDVDPNHGWLALEWIAGGALREAIRTRDVARLVPLERWAVPLAAAVARVHAAGWVHNDLKPANVLLRSADVPVITDFGIARRAGEPAPAGSLGYVSPERLAGRASDARDDVYAFGRILEDALEALRAPSEAQLRLLASACVGADDARPADGRALLTRLKVEVAP